MISLTPAERLLQSYGITRPNEIDLETIAYELGAQIKYRPLEGCEARIVGTGNSAIISVNSISSIPRQRFSIAHELGHWKYHRGKQLDCRADNADISKKNTSEFERIADDYAANLILPRYLLRPILKNHANLSFSIIDDVAKEFSTSFTATAIRTVESNKFPCLLICHNSHGRKWFTRSPDVPKRWFPRNQVELDSSAFDILFGQASNDRKPKRVPAQAWFDRREAEDFDVLEQSMRMNEQEVLSILSLFDDKMLEEN